MSRDFARDQALETILLALELEPELVPVSGRIAFMHARVHPRLREFGDRLVCHQDFKPQAAALESAGWRCPETLEGKFSLILLLPDRQREETLADMALAFDLLEDDGVLMVGLHNDWGAKRFEKNLAEFAGEVGTLSKHHCRAFWARKTDDLDQEEWREWREMGEFRRVIDDRFWSRPGLFSWDEIDHGSQFLADHLPETIQGRVADLGAAWGFLSDFVMRKYPEVVSLDCFEADRAAVECLRRNLGSIPCRYKAKVHWFDVSEGVRENRYDFIVMNPPFHEGRQPDPLLGAKFIAAAHRALKPEGQLWMVANRHMPYEHLLAEIFRESKLVIQEGGFKVLTGLK